MARLLRQLLLLLLATLFSIASASPNPPQCDPPPIQRARAGLLVLTQCFQTLGGTLPQDSRADGTFDRTAGDSHQSGAVQILTRGATQTSQAFTVADVSEQTVFFNGFALRKEGDAVTRLSLERSLSSDSALLPIILVAALLQDQQSGVEFIGDDNLSGITARHLRLYRHINDPNFDGLSEFGAKDIWIAADSGLPLEISYDERDGGGSAPRVPVSVFFSDFRSIDGVYPFWIVQNRNGTPYLTIHVSTVSFNVGLTNQNFASDREAL